MFNIELGEETEQKLFFVSNLKGIPVEEYMSQIIKEHIDSIKVEDIMGKVEELFGNKAELTVNPTQQTIPYNRGDKNTPFFVPASARKIYSYVSLKRDTVKSSTKPLKLDIYCMLLIKEYIERGLTLELHEELLQLIKLNHHTINMGIYNVLENKQLNELMTEFLGKMSKCSFSMSDEYIQINNEVTKLTKRDVEEIVHRLDNCNYKEQCMWKVQKMFGGDKLHVRIICENKDNHELLNLIRTEKSVNVVNNREKRQNLLMSGGI